MAIKRRFARCALIAAKWVLLLVLLGWIAYSFDMSKIIATLRNVDLVLLLPGFSCAILHAFTTSVRWRYVCQAFGQPLSLSDSIRANVYGSFVQNFTPGGVGLDGVRIALNAGLSRWQIALMTLYDKGLLAVITITLFAFLQLALSTPILIMVALLSLLLCMLPVQFINSLFTHNSSQPFRIGMFFNKGQIYFGAFVKAFVIGVITILNFSLILFFTLTAMQLETNMDVILGFPMSVLISSLPLSPGGFGVREWASVTLLDGGSAISPEEMVGASATFGVLFLIGTSISGLVLVFYRYIQGRARHSKT